MKLKQILALLLALSMLLLVACDTTPSETTTQNAGGEETTTAPAEETTTALTVPPTPTIMDPEIVLPLDEIKNAVTIAASPVTETKEIPLLIILANFDADGDGENDWDPNDTDKLYSDNTAPYYGEQWVSTKLSDHYDLYFGDGYSLTNFYEEMTMGVFRYVPIEFDVVPEGALYDKGCMEVTVNLPHPSALGKLMDNSAAAQKCIKTVFEATDPYIDYTKYDLNDNGKIDEDELGVVILNPGQDQSNGNSTMGGRHYFQVWGTSQGLPAYCDGLSFSKVSNYGEYGKNSEIMQIGTPAHELAHNLGAEDLYGRNGGNVAGWPMPYNFSLQCNGNHAGGGTRPTYLDPYQRIYLGWADYEVVEDGVYTIKSTLTDEYKILRVNTPDPQEYYLIEVRHKVGFESNLTSGSSKGGIMVWHIDEDINDRYFIDGQACSSAKVGGKFHDPGIVPLFRTGYDEEGRYMASTAPSDPFYYYDPDNLSAAIFDSGNFRSVTNGTQSLNSYPVNWEGDENYNLHIEVLTAPGEEMTLKITSGTKDFLPVVDARANDVTTTSAVLGGTLMNFSKLDITSCAIYLASDAEFTKDVRMVKATISEDGKTISGTFEGLTAETKYYYKTYLVSELGAVEDTASFMTLPPPKEATECRANLYSDPDAKAYSSPAVYGKILEIPSGWQKSIERKHPGMKLEGWYYDAELTKPYDFTKPVEKGTEDFDLYAKWVPAS